MNFRNIATTLVLFCLAGSAAQAQEYRRATDMERIQAYCQQVGASAERGSFAFGSPLFVAVSGIASAIGNGIEHQQAYDRCMAYNGFVRSDSGAAAPVNYRAEPAMRPQPRYEADEPDPVARRAGPVVYKHYKLGG